MTVGKLKGGEWERQVCRKLSLWISEGQSDDLLWRSAMSGGRATIGLAKGIKRGSQAGDISAVTSLGEQFIGVFIVECKFYKDLQVLQGICKDTGLLYQFWSTLVEQARMFNKLPLLVVRQNNMPPFCLISYAGLEVCNLLKGNVIAVLPRWPSYMVLFDCFLREAKRPDLKITIDDGLRKRVKL